MRRTSGQWMVLLGIAFMAAAVLVLYFEENEAPQPETGAVSTEAASLPEGRQPEPEDEAVLPGQDGSLLAAPLREQAEEEAWQNEKPVVAVSGQVRDRSGQPLAGVTVTVIRLNPRGVGGRVLAHCLSDERGIYLLHVAREGGLVIDAYDDEHQLSRIKMLKEGGEEHDFELEPVESP